MKRFSFKTKPFAHQRREFLASRDEESRAIFWEQGTGKTKLLLDTAAWLHCRGQINGVLVVAPNGVHRNWITDELPAHLSVSHRAHCYEAGKARTNWHLKACEELLRHDGLVVLAMTYEALATKRGSELAERFMRQRTVLFILDEARRIKTPRAKRTKAVMRLRRLAPYRRVLTGTPVANGPFDVYMPILFLESQFWRPHGLGTYGAFKTYFGIWEQRERKDGQKFPALVAFRGLDRLSELLAPIANRVMKDEVLDLPPKLYTQRYFDATREQARLYRQLRDEYIALLDSGEVLTAPLAITRELRLRQVLSGYVPDDDSSDLHEIPGGNPRLAALLDLCEDIPHQAIIWACFRRDIDLICAALGDEAVRYDGAVSQAGRAESLRRFRLGTAKWFVGNPQAGGMGLTLNEARTVIYYNNDSDLEKRQQSEDRAHRIGQEHPVGYVDLVCSGTVDVKIAKALQRKERISAKILGDELRKEV